MDNTLENMETEPAELIAKYSKLIDAAEDAAEKKTFPSPFAEAAAKAETLWNTQQPPEQLEYPSEIIETVEEVPLRITCHPKWSSKMRSKEFGCLEFGVTWSDSSTTIEPIWNLIDIPSKSVTCKLLPILRFYQENTRIYPSTKRQCWFCKRYCNKGKDICYAHRADESWVYSAIAHDHLSDSEDSEIVDPLGVAMSGLNVSD